ncbi:MAG: transporter, partial [Chitinivibrionia bacterium]|nr:transporter [Chitinivibrionia bacterium]
MVLICCCVLVEGALAHHGVASLGVAGLEGPGSPIETSSSATLPKGSV